MARPGLMKHRKFLRLASMLGGPAIARGHLEMVWDAAYECGEPYLGDAVDVEIVAGWSGEPGALVNALLTCGGDGAGFIEEIPDRPGRYQVHDLFHHAPDYVRKRWTREADRRSYRCNLARTAVIDRTVTGHGAAGGRTPAPAPAPAPALAPLEKTQDTGGATAPKPAAPVKRFTPPSSEEVQTYLDGLGERRFTGAQFVDSNTARGWVVGKAKAPMKDWRAAVRTWISFRNDDSAKQKASRPVTGDMLAGEGRDYSHLDS